MDHSERRRIVTFAEAVDRADPKMAHNAGSPISVADVERAMPGMPDLVSQVVRFINTRPADPFENL